MQELMEPSLYALEMVTRADRCQRAAGSYSNIRLSWEVAMETQTDAIAARMLRLPQVRALR